MVLNNKQLISSITLGTQTLSALGTQILSKINEIQNVSR